jgi:hypothetical protein
LDADAEAWESGRCDGPLRLQAADRGLRGKPQTALSVDSNFPGFFENLKICDFD